MVPKCLENCPILPRYSYSMSELCSLSSTYGLRHLGFALNAFVVKVILTGASGLIGSELLSQLIQNASITSIIILSRRPLDEIAATDPRIKVFVIKNFLEYEDEAVKEMAGAKAVFW
jgi:hypothetical protein